MTMHKQIGVFCLAALLAAALIAGCNGPGPASPNSPAADGVPRALHTIEGSAEDIIDFAPNGEWAKVSDKLSAITTAWNVYQPQATRAGASQTQQDAFATALGRLQAGASAQDAPVTMQAANDLGAAVIDLFAIYNPATPADIGRLDVFERQVVLDLAANNVAAATASLAKTQAIWASVKPSVLTHNGQAVADKFEASLATQAQALQANDAAAVTAEAKNGLEIVDELEKLY